MRKSDTPVPILKDPDRTANQALPISLTPFESEIPRNDSEFPTQRRPEYRTMKVEDLPSLEELEDWCAETGLVIGDVADTPERRRKAIGAFWIWRDVHAHDHLDLVTTDIIRYEMNMSKDTIPHATPFRRKLSPRDRKFLYDACLQGLETGLYERVPKDEPLSAWDAPPVIVSKPRGGRRLTFNYGTSRSMKFSLPSILNC